MHTIDTDDTHDPAAPSPLFQPLRAEMSALDTPPGVKKELMAAFASRHRPQPWYKKFPAALWGMAGAIGSIAAVLLVFMFAFEAPTRTQGEAGVPLVGRDDSGVAFIALDSFERIEQDPAPRLVEATVPRTALASLGVPVTPENAGDSVLAEMLVGADGRPLALRLVSQ